MHVGCVEKVLCALENEGLMLLEDFVMILVDVLRVDDERCVEVQVFLGCNVEVAEFKA